jgi:hypothetical protein
LEQTSILFHLPDCPFSISCEWQSLSDPFIH